MTDLPSADPGKTERTYAHLTVQSESLSPAEMEEALGIRPDVSWKKGDPHRLGLPERLRRSNAVVIESTLERDNADPHDHIEDLLKRLTPNAKAIKRLAEDGRVHSARPWLYWSTAAENPGLSFPHETLRAITDLGVSLELDIYVDTEDDGRPSQEG